MQASMTNATAQRNSVAEYTVLQTLMTGLRGRVMRCKHEFVVKCKVLQLLHLYPNLVTK